MENYIIITTKNYDGQIGEITFYPSAGGSIYLGSVLLPYIYYSDDLYGKYKIYIPSKDVTCEFKLITPTQTPTKTPSPTPTSPIATFCVDIGSEAIPNTSTKMNFIGYYNGYPWFSGLWTFDIFSYYMIVYYDTIQEAWIGAQSPTPITPPGDVNTITTINTDVGIGLMPPETGWGIVAGAPYGGATLFINGINYNDNSCLVTPTPTNTPTVTPTIPCNVTLISTTYVSGTTWNYNFTTAGSCGTLSLEYSSDNITWFSAGAGGCTSPRPGETGISGGTIYFRISLICFGATAVSNVITYVFPTPTPTPTKTPTPTPTKTPTRTPIPTRTPTQTPTPTVTITRTPIPTRTVTPTITPTNSVTPTNTTTVTPTKTTTPTVTPTSTNPPCLCVEVVVSQKDIDDAIRNTIGPVNNIVSLRGSRQGNCNGSEILYDFTSPGTYYFCVKSGAINTLSLFYYLDNVPQFYPSIDSEIIVSILGCNVGTDCGINPSPTPTRTLTPTPTPTNILLVRYNLESCCSGFPTGIMDVPSIYGIGDVVLATNGLCYIIIEIATRPPSLTYSSSYIDCETCNSVNNPCPTPTPTPTITTTPTPTPTTPLDFVSVWRTTIPSESITLPLISTGTYSFTVNWGDGNTNVITSWNQPAVTHTYSNPDDYVVTISGTIIGWSFLSNSTSRTKLISISKWGVLRFTNDAGAFYFCTNLNLSTVIDTINLNGITRLREFFRLCSSLTTINNINLWDLSGIDDLYAMFWNATNFNDNISNWNVSSVTVMSNMFLSALNFNNGGNSGINNWNVSNLLFATSMFERSFGFQQPIYNWNVINLTAAQNFMKSKTNSDYSSTEMDNIFNTWSTLNVKPNVIISFGTISYTPAGVAGRNILTNSPNNWTITPP